MAQYSACRLARWSGPRRIAHHLVGQQGCRGLEDSDLPDCHPSGGFPGNAHQSQLPRERACGCWNQLQGDVGRIWRHRCSHCFRSDFRPTGPGIRVIQHRCACLDCVGYGRLRNLLQIHRKADSDFSMHYHDAFGHH